MQAEGGISFSLPFTMGESINFSANITNIYIYICIAWLDKEEEQETREI